MDRTADIQLIVDIDKTGKYTKALDMVSGTVSRRTTGPDAW